MTLDDLKRRQLAQACFAIVYHREGFIGKGDGGDPIKKAMAATGWNRAAVIRAVTEEFDREIRGSMPDEMVEHLWLRTEALWSAEALDKITDGQGKVKAVGRKREAVKTQADIRTDLHGEAKETARGKLLKWKTEG